MKRTKEIAVPQKTAGADEEAIRTTITISRYGNPRLHAAARAAGSRKDQTPAMIKQLAEEALYLRELRSSGQVVIQLGGDYATTSATPIKSGETVNMLDGGEIAAAIAQFAAPG